MQVSAQNKEEKEHRSMIRNRNRNRNRPLGFALATIVLGTSFLGCPFLKKKGDDTTTEDAATVSVSGTGAKNEASILRYANELPLANEPAVIGKDGAKARNFPGNGPEVATLVKGTVVAKIASYFSTGVLIMFDDPSGDGSKLLGWVSPTAFDTSAPAPTKTVFVPPRVVDGGVRVVDAGTITTDAGRMATVVDAGPSNFGNVKGRPAVSPIDGKCPPADLADSKMGWVINGGMCRRACKTDAECPRGIKCSTQRVCTSG